jgi:hypothetical protein
MLCLGRMTAVSIQLQTLPGTEHNNKDCQTEHSKLNMLQLILVINTPRSVCDLRLQHCCIKHV